MRRVILCGGDCAKKNTDAAFAIAAAIFIDWHTKPSIVNSECRIGKAEFGIGKAEFGIRKQNTDTRIITNTQNVAKMAFLARVLELHTLEPCKRLRCTKIQTLKLFART